MIILDTNVLSEAMKRVPATEVLTWLAKQPSSRLFTTSVSQSEILFGVELLPKGRRLAALQTAVEAMFEEDFAGRVLPFDADAARRFARIAAARRASGRPISHADAQIAAIASSRGAMLATRNMADFENCGIGLINPWTSR